MILPRVALGRGDLASPATPSWHPVGAKRIVRVVNLTHVLCDARGCSGEELEGDVGCGVGCHCGFEAAAGVEVAVDDAGDGVEDEDAGEEPRGEFAEAEGDGEVAESEEERGQEDGAPEGAGGGAVVAGVPEFGECPGDGGDEEEAGDELFGDAAVEEAGEEAFPERDIDHPLCEVEAGAWEENEGVECDEHEAGAEADDGGVGEAARETGARGAREP